MAQLSRRKTATPLTAVLEWPSLVRAYPHLENVEVSFTDDKSEGGSYWHDGGANGIIYITRANDQKMLSVLRHEIQHAIQEFEGWPTGYNTD